jgi:hypothetical protein
VLVRGSVDVETAVSRSREGKPVWGWLLMAALLLLLFEGWFANRIATRRAAGEAA